MPIQLDAIEQAQSTLIDLAIKLGPRVAVAILIMTGGFYAARWIGAVTDQWLGKLSLEPPVRLLLVRAARLVVLGLFLIRSFVLRGSSTRLRCASCG